VSVKALQVAALSPRDARLDGFPASQKSKFRAVTRESIDHGISIVKASQLPNQVVVDAFVHGGRGARTVSGAAPECGLKLVAGSQGMYAERFAQTS
jgi:hypothetical protein